MYVKNPYHAENASRGPEEDRQGVFDFFFSPLGRLSRSQFLFGNTTIFSIVTILNILAPAAEPPEEFALGEIPFTLTLSIFLIMYSLVCIHAKRFHDRNKTGKWALLGPSSFISAFLSIAGEGSRFEHIFNALMLFSILLWVVSSIEALVLASSDDIISHGSRVDHLPWYPDFEIHR
jgi:uncharacterized membrane protein YhaH (DUF805 family)